MIIQKQSMKIFFIFLCLLFTFIANSQNFVWAKTFGNANDESAKANATDASGNIITVGTFVGTVDFDPNAGISNLVSTSGSIDIYLSKLNSSGNLVWAKKIGSTGSESANDIVTDASGNIYITGEYSGTVDFDPNAGIVNLTSSSSSRDVFIAKYDANGNILWAKSMGGANVDIGQELALDASNNLYVAGTYSGTVDFDPSASTRTLTVFGGSGDLFVGKYDSNGNYLWAWGLGGNGSETATGIKYNSTNNFVYLTGTFTGTNTSITPNYAGGTFNSAGGSDCFITRLDASTGTGSLTRGVFGGTGFENTNDLEIDSNGNIFIAGDFGSTIDVNIFAGVNNLAPTGFTDGFILKYNTALTLSYAKQFDHPNNTGSVYSNSLKLDGINNIYIGGYLNDVTDFDPDAVTTFTYTTPDWYDYDCFVAKLDPNGNFVWAKKWGGTDFSAMSEEVTSITLDPSGNIYTCGTFGGSTGAACDFNPDAGTNNVIAVTGGVDAFIHKLGCTLPSTVTTTSNVTPICIGTSTTKTISISSTIESGVTYSWGFLGSAGVSFSPNTGTNTSISYTATSSFSIVVTATNACGTTTTMVQSITPYALPSLTITTDYPSVCAGQPNGFHATGAQTYTWNPGYIINNMPSVNYGSGIFTVTATDANGCVNSKTINYTEYPLPNVTAIANPTIICANKTGTLTAGGASSYTWTSGPTTQNYVVNSAGIYTVTGQDINGCVNTKTVSLSVNPIPNVVAGYNFPATFCNGYTVTLISSGASTYSWTGGPSTSNYNVSTSGIYTVTGTDGNGCSNTATIHPIFNPNPTVTISAPKTDFCHFQGGSITASGADNYAWTPSLVNGFNNFYNWGSTPIVTTYTVRGTYFTGCADSTTVTITVHPNPTITVTGNSITCSGATNILTGHGGTTYTWSPGAVVSPTYAANATILSTYSVSAYDAFGCFGDTTFTYNTVLPQTPEICEVTVDSLSQFNHIIWDKTSYTNVDSFIVYREVSTNIYRRIGAQDKNAISLFIDTARSIGPANGDPNITSYRYKLQIRDTCGNYSVKSPYHNTIFFITNTTGTFFWNTYNIEFQGSTPVSTFDLIRDNNATGTWTVVGSAAGTASSLNDPNYLSYPNAIYRVYANGFNCNPTAKTMQQVNKSKSNVRNNLNIPLGISAFNLNAEVSIAPNPANSNISVYFKSDISEKTVITLTDIIGQEITNQTMTEGNKMNISLNDISSGVYFIKIQQGKYTAIKKFIKE